MEANTEYELVQLDNGAFSLAASHDHHDSLARRAGPAMQASGKPSVESSLASTTVFEQLPVRSLLGLVSMCEAVEAEGGEALE